ncbi:MAG: Yip1 family protein [Pyrinomonadaceae bacterium]
MTNSENAEWQAPPPPEKIAPVETAQMSEVATLGNIFIEPGNVFEDLRRKPRFLLAAIIMSLLITAYGFGLYYKIGDAGFRTFYNEQIDKTPQGAAVTGEQRNSTIDMYMTIGTVTRYAMPLFVLLIFAIGGLIYWVASKAFGGTGGFLQALSTWLYSSFPPTVVSMIASYIILVFKDADNIDLAASQAGVVHANLGFFIDNKAHPMLNALLGTFDFFMIWGWILAVIGLQKTMRLSAGSAWTLTIILALVSLGFRMLFAAIS